MEVPGRPISLPDTVIHYGFDGNGNVTGMTDPLGGGWEYEFDPMGRMTRINNPWEEETTFEYDLAGRRLKKSLANGLVTNYNYNDTDNLRPCLICSLAS